MNLEKLAREIAMCKSPNVDKWLVPIDDLESMISLIQRQESELAKSHDENETLKAEREAMALQLAARQPLADSFVAKLVAGELPPLPAGYSVNRVEGHGWYIDPPQGGRWVAYEGTPAADFIAALRQPVQQPAAVGEQVAYIEEGKYGNRIIWLSDEVMLRTPVGAKLYTAPVPAAGVQGDPTAEDYAAVLVDDVVDEVMKERDQYHDIADGLAEAIATYFGADIGEHSSANCPWAEALRVIEEAPEFVATPPANVAQAAPEVASVPDAVNLWEQGALMAAAIVITCHDMPVVAGAIIGELGLSNADCSSMDEFDKTALRKVQGERSGTIALRGLNAAPQTTEKP